jgi:2,4-dienoyl-CoA reductase-like NADH-dependent reductase (Old Yellow Enzyme family)
LRSEEQHKTAVEPTAPSPVYDALFERTPRALAIEEINEITDKFAEAIRRAQEAEFDGVQIHAAHGYLLSSFLSPYTNKRDDQYGGSTENRVRILREIYEKAKKKVGKNFPILVKINTTDFLPGGMDIKEAGSSAEILEKIEFAAIETSGGMWEAVTQSQEELGWPPVILPESRTEIKSKDQEAYFLPSAKTLKESIGWATRFQTVST